MNPEHAMSIADVLLTGSIILTALVVVALYATRAEPKVARPESSREQCQAVTGSASGMVATNLRAPQVEGPSGRPHPTKGPTDEQQ